ncbi:unnamed protein product [Hymenolepis diminuta]|uniref:Ig-like domain-containing protein n=1 Tax=Hymenolepis diminuta TaxID=6216 RepID=A0A3P7ABV0_HYMDI|nr:unnamed protein product [Hymenolepis diminuta]
MSHFAKSVFLTSGQPGHLACCLSGFPEVSEVIWHRRALISAVKGPEQSKNNTMETEIISGQSFSVKQLVKSPYHLNASFKNDVNCYKKLISHVIPELSGVYTCQGKNALGWGQRSMSFDVFVQVRPYFTQKPDKHPSQQVSFPEVLQSCKAEGFPPPEVTPKQMKRNISAISEMTKSGDQWLFCPSDSVTLCWTTEKFELLTKSSKSNREVGIYACIASNDLGTEIALSNLVDPEQPSEWLFALSIDVVDSLACSLRIMMEVFTWTSAVLPKKVILEYHECSFSVEFSTSLREKHWQREKISRESIRRGEFEIRNLASNTLTAVRVYMSCSSGEPVMSNTVYGWSKATANSTECSPNLTLHEKGKSKTVISTTTPAPEQDVHTPVKVLLTCGTLILILLSIFAILLVYRSVRMRAGKRILPGARYSGPQNASTWRDGCGESPAIYTTSVPTTITDYRKGDFQLIPQSLMAEHGIKKERPSQNVTVLNNSIETSEVLKASPSGLYRTAFSPKVEMKELSPIYERSRAATLPIMDITKKNAEWSLTQ